MSMIMSMEFLLASGIGALTAAGIYLIMLRRTFPVVIGLSFLSYAVNVFLFSMGRLTIDLPPIVSEDREGLHRSAAAGAGADRDRHHLRHDGADRRAVAARFSRNRLRRCDAAGAAR